MLFHKQLEEKMSQLFVFNVASAVKLVYARGVSTRISNDAFALRLGKREGEKTDIRLGEHLCTNFLSSRLGNHGLYVPFLPHETYITDDDFSACIAACIYRQLCVAFGAESIQRKLHCARTTESL